MYEVSFECRTFGETELLVAWGEVESEGWVSDLLRGNIFPSFSMIIILLPTNVISVNSSIHVDSEYMCSMAHTHVCQDLLVPKARKRTFKFGEL
jgi:hypothetical protein